MDDLTLYIAEVHIGTYALGPGFRAGVWVQGCPIHCKGCIAPEWILPGGKPVYIRELAERILADKRIQGITLSGGEPMEQAKGLAELLRIIKNMKPELTVICFTGYLYRNLLKRPPSDSVGELISYLDLLIDGPYIQFQNDNVGLRGSRNQRFHYLTDRLKGYDLEIQPRRIEVNLQGGQAFIVGVPPKKFFDAWENAFPPLLKES